MNKNRNHASKIDKKIARKIAKKLAVGAMKVAAAPIVGGLSARYKYPFYEEEIANASWKTHPKTIFSTYVSAITPIISGAAIGAYMGGFPINNTTNYFEGAAIGALVGVIGSMINEFSTERMDYEIKGDLEDGYFSKPNLIGKIIELGLDLGISVKDYFNNIYPEVKNEISEEKRQRLVRLEELGANVNDTAEFADRELLRISNGRRDDRTNLVDCLLDGESDSGNQKLKITN